MTEKEINTDIKQGYEKTKLEWLPKEWEIKKLGELYEFKNGVNAGKEAYGTGVKFVNVMDVFRNTYISHDNIIGSVSLSDKQKEKNLLEKGDVLFNRTSEVQEEIGMTALYDDEKEAVFGGFVIRGRPKTKELSPKFSVYGFQSEFVRRQIIGKGQGAVRVNIGQSDLEQVFFPIPPEKEQEELINILSYWDEAISKVQKLIKAKKRYKKGLMQRLLSGKVRFPEFEGEWVESRFKDVVKIDAKSLNSKTSPNFSFQYISLSDIKNGIISIELEYYDYKNAPSRAKRIVSEGDILMATVRPNLQAFAMAKKNHQDMIASTGFAVLSPKKNFNIKYLYHYLYSDHISSQLHALTVGSNYPAINSSDVKNLKINIPTDEEEIDKIESVFTTIDTEIKAIEKIKALFIIQKKGLMQKLITGNVRVNTKQD